jgi:AcrR family transcriptional regulator
MAVSGPGADGRSKKRPGVEEQSAIIMQAAVALFAEAGVSPVSIAQICHRAGVSRPTFYRCFNDKDALVSRIYEESVNAFVETFLVDVRQREPRKLKQQLDGLLDSIFGQSQLAQLVFRESNDPDSPAARIIDTAFEQAADSMVEQSRRKHGDKPSRVFLKSVMAAIQWIVQDAIRKGLTEDSRAEARSAAFTLVSRVLF